MKKLAITIDAALHAKVVEAAEREGVSVSAWMTAAARQVLRAGDGLAAVAEWEAEQGEATADELEAARRSVAGPPDEGQLARGAGRPSERGWTREELYDRGRAR